MIDQPTDLPAAAAGAGAAARGGVRGPAREPGAAREPGSRRRAVRVLVLLAALVCAACGLVYELELVALATGLLGDTVTQASVVLSVMVFAMGLGSLLAKRLARRPLAAFGAVECALALVGGLSALLLYGCFAWFGGWYRVALVGCAGLIGVLMGAEIPLLVVLVQRVRRRGTARPAPRAEPEPDSAPETGRMVADLFAADYVGALVGGLAFPFLLLPLLGQVGGALLTGAVNAVAGGAVLLGLGGGGGRSGGSGGRSRARPRLLTAACCAAVLAVLGIAGLCATAFEHAARRALFGQRARVVGASGEAPVVVTGEGGSSGARVYAAGRAPLCAAGAVAEARALAGAAGRADGTVLVVDGGDGLTAGQLAGGVPGSGQVVVVDPDRALVLAARTDPVLLALNADALDSPRVRVVQRQPLGYARSLASGGAGEGAGAGPGGRGRLGAVLVELPPRGAQDSEAPGSLEFFGLLERALRPGGRIVVRTERDRLWTVVSTLRALGLRTAAYVRPPAAACAGTAPEEDYVIASAGGSADPAAARVPVPGAPVVEPHTLPPPQTLLGSG